MIDFTTSPWYSDIVHVLQNLQAPVGLSKTRARSVKFKAAKVYILNQYFYWKDPGGVLLNFLLENESQQMVKEFHKGDYGGHHSWKVTPNKILRAGFYWPSLFSDVYKETSTCHQCQIFYGKRKVINPITVEAHFQQWGLDFIGEINPNSSGQHKWILTAADYFTKWIEAIPTRRATETVIMDFLEENILARFWCPRRILTDNAASFNSKG